MLKAQETTFYHKLKPLLYIARVEGLFYINTSKKKSNWCTCEKIYSGTVAFLLTLNVARFLTAFNVNESLGVEFINKIILITWIWQVAINAIVMHVKSPTFFQLFVRLERHLDRCVMDSGYVREIPLKRLRIACYVFGGIIVMICLLNILWSTEVRNDPAYVYTFLPPLQPGSVPHETAVIIFLVIIIPVTFYLSPHYLVLFVIFSCICYIIWKEFVYFNKKLESVCGDGEFIGNLEDYRICHNEICNLVDLADDVFSLYIANLFVCTIVIFCLSLYIVVYFSSGNAIDYLAPVISYIIYNSFVLTTVTLCAAKVNREVGRRYRQLNLHGLYALKQHMYT